MRYLYKFKKLNICHSQIEDNFECGLFSPSIKKWRLLNEKLTFKKFAARVMFFVITAGKSKVCYVIKDDKVVHTSYVVPSCYKFAFLSRND